MSIASGYLPILIMIVLGIILAGVFSFIGLFLGPKLRDKVKEMPFESGFLRDADSPKATSGVRRIVRLETTCTA